MINNMDDWPSPIAWPNQISTRKHFSSNKLSSSSCIRASTRTRQRSLTNLQNIDKRAITDITLVNLYNSNYAHCYMIKCSKSIIYEALNDKGSLTTRLPFSKLVVYLKVQKSRAGANVVGAYVCINGNLIVILLWPRRLTHYYRLYT